MYLCKQLDIKTGNENSQTNHSNTHIKPRSNLITVNNTTLKTVYRKYRYLTEPVLKRILERVEFLRELYHIVQATLKYTALGSSADIQFVPGTGRARVHLL